MVFTFNLGEVEINSFRHINLPPNSKALTFQYQIRLPTEKWQNNIFKDVITGNSIHDTLPNVILVILTDKIDLALDIMYVLPKQFF